MLHFMSWNYAGLLGIGVDFKARLQLRSWVKKKELGGLSPCFCPVLYCFCRGCASGKSLHPRSTCRSVAFCVRRCEPTECLTFPYLSYNPKVVMEIHWGGSGGQVTVEGRVSQGRRSISPGLFCELLLSVVRWWRECWPEALVYFRQKAGQITQMTGKNPSTILSRCSLFKDCSSSMWSKHMG